MSETEAKILAAIEGVAGRLEKMDARLSKVEATSASTLEQVSDLTSRMAALPDMHYLAAAAKAQLVRLREVMENVAQIKVRMDEIYGAMATDSEIQNLRNEVTRFRDDSVDIEVRLGTLEGHAGLKTSGP